MGFIKKEEIVKRAETFVNSNREKALECMRNAIELALNQAAEVAGKTGDNFAYMDVIFTIHDIFQDSKGYYVVPVEIEAELAEAGFGIRWIKANRFTII